MVIFQTAREGILEYCILNSEDTLGETSAFPDDIATNTQYALINQDDNIPAHSLQHGRKRHYSSNPNWMFYVIFATGILMLVVTEMFLRLDYSKLVPQTGPRSDYFISNRRGSNIKRTEREKVQDVRYAAANTDVLPMYSEATTMPKRFTPTMHRKKSWSQDPLVYQVEENIIRKRNQPRVFYIDPRIKDSDIPRRPLYVPDSTQLYQSEAIDSIDISLHDNAEECFPMNDWQSAYYPTCNEIHQMDVIQENMQLLGLNGYWRYAFRIDYSCPEEKNSSDIAGGCKESVIFKTLKFEHNFEANNYEHDRIDALAMEHLTSSKHVINIFSHCGNSVVTEYADGDRVGTLADTKKKEPLSRLKIARDIASGLADVHEANLVHFDVNLANIVSIGGTLKLNDFNIGVMQKRNVTSGKTCDFPSQFSNPQVSQYLSSMLTYRIYISHQFLNSIIYT